MDFCLVSRKERGVAQPDMAWPRKTGDAITDFCTLQKNSFKQNTKIVVNKKQSELIVLSFVSLSASLSRKTDSIF